MKKMMKKIIALALAMSFVGAVTAHTNIADYQKPGITANAADSKVTLSYANVELADSISLKFYAEAATLDAANIDSVVMNGPNGSITVEKADFKIAKGSYNVFTYPLYATQLGKDVAIQFKKGGTAVEMSDNKGTSFTTTVNAYCDAVLSDPSFSESELDATKSLKNLGIAAVNYFDDYDNPHDMSGDFLDSTYDLDNYAPSFYYPNERISLVLDSVFSIRLYLNSLTEASTATSIFFEDKAIKGSGIRYYFEASVCSPIYLGNGFTLTYKGKLYKASALSWCYRAINNENVNTQNMAKAIFEYYRYVYTYYEPEVVFDNHTYRFKFDVGETWQNAIDRFAELSVYGDMVIYTDNNSAGSKKYRVDFINYDNAKTPVKPDSMLENSHMYTLTEIN